MTDRSIPERVGRYRILCELGRGAMAVLYLGRAGGPGSFERLFAIKMIHEHLASQRAFVTMFLNEARIAARLHHPNVVGVYEVDCDAGRYFLAMDYVSGENMALALKHTWNRGRPFPVPIAAQVVAQVAEGLHAAHELRDPHGTPLGVVHRDVAPQNIMMSFDGSVRVMDFGIAKSVDQVSDTRPGAMKGTIAYMAPEQVRGQPLDRRVDVFALGTVLWEATVGKRLFKSTSDIKTAARVMSMEIPRPSALRPDYPPELERIVLKALARDKDARYSTSRALGEDLQAFLQAGGHRVGPSELEAFTKSIFPDLWPQRAEMERRATALVAPERVESLQRLEESELDLSVITVPAEEEMARAAVAELGSDLAPESAEPTERASAPGREPETIIAVPASPTPHEPAAIIESAPEPAPVSEAPPPEPIAPPPALSAAPAPVSAEPRATAIISKSSPDGPVGISVTPVVAPLMKPAEEDKVEVDWLSAPPPVDQRRQPTLVIRTRTASRGPTQVISHDEPAEHEDPPAPDPASQALPLSSLEEDELTGRFVRGEPLFDAESSADGVAELMRMQRRSTLLAIGGAVAAGLVVIGLVMALRSTTTPDPVSAPGAMARDEVQAQTAAEPPIARREPPAEPHPPAPPPVRAPDPPLSVPPDPKARGDQPPRAAQPPLETPPRPAPIKADPPAKAEPPPLEKPAKAEAARAEPKREEGQKRATRELRAKPVVHKAQPKPKPKAAKKQSPLLFQGDDL